MFALRTSREGCGRRGGQNPEGKESLQLVSSSFREVDGSVSTDSGATVEDHGLGFRWLVETVNSSEVAWRHIVTMCDQSEYDEVDGKGWMDEEGSPSSIPRDFSKVLMGRLTEEGMFPSTTSEGSRTSRTRKGESVQGLPRERKRHS